jgi:3-oxoadipate enol-lactonase
MTGCELNYALDGVIGGPAVLLGGSLGANLAMWQPQLPVLSARFSVIRYDHRGHGGSPVAPGPYTIDELGSDVLAMLDRLQLERVSWCGLSLGGMVGMWLSINAPARIERLVLICTSAYLPPAQAWTERAATVREAGSPEAVADAVIARWFTEPFARERPDIVGRHRAMIASTSAEGYAGCCEAIAIMDLRPGLAGIVAPTLVIAGEQDPATPPEHARTIAAGIPGARLEILDPAAHLCNVERSADVTALIVDHLNAGERP